ncbi:flagellar brake protein [Desulfurivibrio sp. D14AmB]|uniref:flagellar brake protein n=1 Tax=Desulfurivibrio sp. D14AmB TaxID=3374370 RepID=UPI00376EDBA5
MTTGISEEHRALSSGWVDFGDGIHATRSAKIIQQALHIIKQQHIFCVVVAKGYESGKVVMLEYDSERVVLDMPVDWPPGMTPQPLRILFKDKGQLWNQFSVKLLEVTADTLITTVPFKYVQLQRRANYRVDVPRGSEVAFRHRDDLKHNYIPRNISATGILICLEERRVEGLQAGDLLGEITMTFPCEGGQRVRLRVKEARVVRVCENERREPCFGLQFLLRPQEEKEVMQYVRLRERELLRKGMAEEL